MMKINFDAILLQGLDLLADDFGTVAVGGLQRAGDRVPTHHVHLVLILGTDTLHGPFNRVIRLFGDDAGQFRIIEVETSPQHVAVHQIDGILDAQLFLQRGAGSGDLAAIDPRIAAWFFHLFNDLDGRPGVMRFDGGGKTGESRSDHDDVHRLVPFARKIIPLVACR